MTIQEAEKNGKFIWRWKKIGFHPRIYYNGANQAPLREDDELDEWDYIFENREHFDLYDKIQRAWYAELDEIMNYCVYFQREKGNEGYYVRNGKKFKVNGEWDGNDVQKMLDGDTDEFRKFLMENGWENNWFKLMPKYEEIKKLEVKKPEKGIIKPE